MDVRSLRLTAAQHTRAVRGSAYGQQVSIAKIEPLTTARALRGPFDYRLPEAMADLAVGSVVKVPFGRRRILGVVVGLADASALPLERLAGAGRGVRGRAPPRPGAAG